MSRSRVEQRARRVYEHLKGNRNKPYRLPDLLAALNLQDSRTTRAAIRRAREYAAEDGLCFPVACPANGHTYCVTDDPSAVVDPSMHLGRIGLGIGVRKDVHDDFIRSRSAQLTPVERSMVHSLEKYEAAQRASREAYSDITKAMVAMRREQRQASDG